MDQFEAYFGRADLDGDGRISGAEAVAFFQGSNLHKNVLAQIWMYADQRKAGFLSRPEFYNALRLVTVAQSKRELTPDIVKAALYSPAAAKISPPQIHLPAARVPQSNSVVASPVYQSNPMAAASVHQSNSVATAPGSQIPPAAAQNFGYRGSGVPNASMNQQSFPSHPNQSMRPPQAMSTDFPSRPSQQNAAPELPRGAGMVGSNILNSNIPNTWLGGTTRVAPSGPRGISASVTSPISSPQAPLPMSSQTMSSDAQALVTSGNGFTSNSVFGGDVFSAAPSPQKQDPFGSLYTTTSGGASSAIVPVSSGPQPSSNNRSLDSLQSAFSMQASGGQFSQALSSLSPSQQVPAPSSSSLVTSGTTIGAGSSTSDSSQPLWPRMKPSDVQKYAKVFREVDSDRDGKISGEQARNLFLSWRLPREVLKQVWDLSDQDTDSMLSLREFCFALYLMERYREGRPLPAALPSSVMYDENLLSMTGQPNVAYGNAAWGPSAGFGQQPGVVNAQSVPSARPPLPTSVPKADGATQSNQRKTGVPVLEDSFLKQHDSGAQETTAAEKKVSETENVILDSKEKIEFYRTKMQELVLYKSRCDNRLNEITERASADKKDAESLAKKYEEKYKQVADIASKLTIEEARFRDIQERKMELHQAIIKIEQGGSADGLLQVRADRIQSDLEELMKALTERSKKHGLDVKSAAAIELPTGWQPGIPGEAALWDEEWDKFEDEGFANSLDVDVPKQTSTAVQSENASNPDSPSEVNGEMENSSTTVGRGLESESAYAHSEDELARSPHDSPSRGNSTEADAETQSHRSFDDSTWGAFDNNDDVDSVWGFNSNTKDLDSEKQGYFFGSDDFGVKPIKTESPQHSTFQRKSPFFEESLPGTPLSRFGNSPTRSEDFSRFDSFSMHDGGYSPKFTRFDSINSSKDFGYNPEKFSRFDSMNSSRDFGNNQGGFSRFDSFNSSVDFGQNSQRLTRFDSANSTVDFGQNSQRHARFDSVSSTKDFGHIGPFLTFDEADPFGSTGPFKVSSETPKKGSENWKAF